MSDPILDPAAAAAAPTPEAPAEAPAAVVEETPAVATETPAAPTGLLAPDAAPAEVPAAPAADAATEKPGETPAAADAAQAPAVDPAASGETPAEAVALPTYEPFTLPEGVVADNEAMGRFTEVLGKHGWTQEQGQELMDLYAAEHGRLMAQMAEHQQQVFEDTQREWTRQFDEDPELGRNRRDTTLREANTAIRWAFGLGIPGEKLTPEEQTRRQAAATKYYTEMSYTGFQNHPENVRAWVRVHNLLKKYLAEPGPPPPGTPPARESLRPADRRYGPNGAA